MDSTELSDPGNTVVDLTETWRTLPDELQGSVAMVTTGRPRHLYVDLKEEMGE